MSLFAVRFPFGGYNAGMMRHAAVLATLSLASLAHAQAIPVTVEKLPGGEFRLLRDGKPFQIRGAGGSGRWRG